jgi:D-alanyl-D-alanine carboxypeptidase
MARGSGVMKRRDFTLGGLGASAGLALAAAGGRADAERWRPPAALDIDLIKPILAATGAPALAGAMLTKDSTPWLRAGGVRRANAPDRATVADQWHIGSNTKAMTAALYARQVEQGKARWGALVPDLFPGLDIHPAWRATPIEALMAHRAGLSDKGLIDAAWLSGSRADPRTLPAQRRALAAKVFAAPPAGKPGDYEYANADYILVGAAIERITGAAWEDVIHRELFKPLAMPGAGFGAPVGTQP